MKPVTALAVIVVVFLVILGIVLWQLGLFESGVPAGDALIQPITPTDLAGITPTDMAGITPTGLAGGYTAGGVDQSYNSMTPVQPANVSYTVKSGDTLWIIAQQFYNGDGSKWKMIQDANKIQNPSKLKAGMVLTIPDVSESAVRHTAPVEPQRNSATYSGTETGTPSTTGGKYHKVVKGDNLWKLARKYYNDSSKSNIIYEANRDKLATPETTLKPGWKLLIPDAPKKAPKPKSSSKKTTTPKKTAATAPKSPAIAEPIAPATPPPTTGTGSTGGDNNPSGFGD